jgi:hypothetical protein
MFEEKEDDGQSWMKRMERQTKELIKLMMNLTVDCEQFKADQDETIKTRETII